MWPLWSFMLLLLLLWLPLSSTISFVNNYLAARKMGLPIVLSPVHTANPFWLITQPILSPMLLKLPFGLGKWVRYNKHGWIWDDQDAMHEEHGKTFVHVTPANLEIRTADLEVIKFIYSKRKSFEKLPNSMPITLLNPSITSVTGADWQRHRRITAPPFNEQNMERAWAASLRQAAGLCEWWISQGEKGVDDANGDTMTLALNVLASAGLGQAWSFVGAGQVVKHGEDAFATTWRDTLLPILTSARTLALTPKSLYDGPVDSWIMRYMVPNFIRKHVILAKEYRGLMQQLVRERKAEVESGQATDSIFLNAMIARSEGMQKELDSGDKKIGTTNRVSMRLGGLSDEELLSNIFAYHVGGLETTAHTLLYTFTILSIEPKWQSWVQQELDRYWIDSSSDPLTWGYENFEKLKRCRAVFFEMLRLFPGIPNHKKDVLGEGSEIPVKGRTIYAPAGSEVWVSALSVHVMAEYWGPDSKELNPSRWVSRSDIPDGEEELLPPPLAKETFFPWSLGQRDCPAKKFSQVEFVAVLAYVLRSFKIECVPIREGETWEEKRARIWAWTKESRMEMALNFRDPSKYRIKLTGR